MIRQQKCRKRQKNNKRIKQNISIKQINKVLMLILGKPNSRKKPNNMGRKELVN